VAFDEMDINTVSVKSGQNSRNVVVACRCVNVGLFLSGSLRTDVEVSILLGNDDDIRSITFPGSSLQRVSPDERSIAFFLLKAHTVLEEMHPNSKRTMDNGIIVHRTTLKEILDRWGREECYIASHEFNPCSDYSHISESGLFLYSIVPEHSYLKDYPAKPLPRPPHPERFILEINLTCDNQL
jgi:tRNA pseudouridine-54 N-methylase